MFFSPLNKYLILFHLRLEGHPHPNTSRLELNCALRQTIHQGELLVKLLSRILRLPLRNQLNITVTLQL